MEHVTGIEPRTDGIVGLFAETFTASEGADEGRLIGTLARDLIERTAPEDIFVFSAEDTSGLAGSIMFTRMSYDDPRRVFLLAPVAVAPDRQGAGIGHLSASAGSAQQVSTSSSHTATLASTAASGCARSPKRSHRRRVHCRCPGPGRRSRTPRRHLAD